MAFQIPPRDRGPEPPPGVNAFSPSGISSALECARKWGWHYISKIPGKQHASARKGELVHYHLEQYLEHGNPPPVSHADIELRDAAKVAVLGIHFLPPPKSPDVVVERGFLFEYGGIWFRGFVDFEEPKRINDHKTSKDIAAYSKSEDDLFEDPQAVIYAWEKMQRQNLDWVDLRWIYYPSEGKQKAQTREIRMTREHARVRMDAIVELCKTLDSALRTGRDPATLPPTVSACGGFGGCAYKENCKPYLTAIQRMGKLRT